MLIAFQWDSKITEDELTRDQSEWENSFVKEDRLVEYTFNLVMHIALGLDALMCMIHWEAGMHTESSNLVQLSFFLPILGLIVSHNSRSRAELVRMQNECDDCFVFRWKLERNTFQCPILVASTLKLSNIVHGHRFWFIRCLLQFSSS